MAQAANPLLLLEEVYRMSHVSDEDAVGCPLVHLLEVSSVGKLLGSAPPDACYLHRAQSYISARNTYRARAHTAPGRCGPRRQT